MGARDRGCMQMKMLQFSIPGLAAEAVNVRQLESSARKAGVGGVQLRYHFVVRESHDGNGYRCRITCSVEMAVFLIEQLRLCESQAVERRQEDIAAACSRGMRETYVALMAPASTRRRSRKRANATQRDATQLDDERIRP